MKKSFKKYLPTLIMLVALFLVWAFTRGGSGVIDPSLTTAAQTTGLTTAAPETAAPATEATTAAPETTAAPPETTTAAPETTAAPPETTTAAPETTTAAKTEAAIDEDGVYTKKDDVALYIHTYGHLPYNFVTKKEAQNAGWTGGSLEPYFPGCCIGGDRFGNYEGLLPKVKGRTYYECDINTLGKKSRGAKRIIFSDDGWIYYTDDHYESFTCLYEGSDD